MPKIHGTPCASATDNNENTRENKTSRSAERLPLGKADTIPNTCPSTISLRRRPQKVGSNSEKPNRRSTVTHRNPTCQTWRATWLTFGKNSM